MSREFIIKEHPLFPYDEEDKPQKLIRCRECKYGQDDLFHMFCVYHHHKTYADDFCSYGEREGE
jgi:hypothetical protein